MTFVTTERSAGMLSHKVVVRVPASRPITSAKLPTIPATIRSDLAVGGAAQDGRDVAESETLVTTVYKAEIVAPPPRC